MFEQHMEANSFFEFIAHIEPIFQVLTGVFVVVIAYITAQHSRRIARLQALQTVVDSWMRFDTLLLTDRDAMAAYNEVAGVTPTEDYLIDWIIYYYINQAYHAFLARAYGGVPKKYLDFELDTVWRNIGHSANHAKRILKDGGYPPNFVKYFLDHQNSMEKRLR